MAEGALWKEQDKPVNLASNWRTTEEIKIPARLMDQVIGQDQAVKIIRRAARQRRSVMLIGEPGTGKSMLGRAMTEWVSPASQVDVLLFPCQQSRNTLLVKTVPAGEGKWVVQQAGEADRRQRWAHRFLLGMFILSLLIVTGYFSWIHKEPLYFTIGISFVLLILWLSSRGRQWATTARPRLLIERAPAKEVPFIDATGLHAGGLLGDVRHDPYQSGSLATSPHQLVEPGAIHFAHGGILFIDELATLDTDTQQRLLTAFQEKKLSITGRNVGSSGTMVRTEPVPCDFILVLAGNLPDLEKLHPALRSRIRGYGYEIALADTMTDDPANREKLARFVAQEVEKDGRIPHFSREAVEVLIEQARRMAGRPHALTTRFRELGGLIRAAGDVAVDEGDLLVLPNHVHTAIESTRPLEEQIRRNDQMKKGGG